METGFVLMGIGMTTVFTILLIVIYLGKGLIAFVNKYVPAEEPAQPLRTTSLSATPANAISETTLAVIISAVSTATQGKGKVIRVEKL